MYSLWKLRNAIRHGDPLLTEEKVILQNKWDSDQKCTTFLRFSNNLTLAKYLTIPEN